MHSTTEAFAPQSRALICLHYFAGSGNEWRFLKHELRSAFNLYTPHLGGFGNTPPPKNGYSVKAYADEVEAYIATLQLPEFILIGHSMGGKIAAAVAARQPTGLLGLVLLSPSPPPGEPIPEEDRKRLLNEYGDRQAAEQTVNRITAKPLTDDVRQQVVMDNLLSNKAAYDAWLLEGSKEDISAETKGISVPVLVIAGTADEAITPDTHRQLTLSALPNNTQVKWLNGIGHLLPLEAPEEVAEAIRTWAEKVIK